MSGRGTQVGRFLKLFVKDREGWTAGRRTINDTTKILIL